MSVGYNEFMAIVGQVFTAFPVIEGVFDKNGEEYILRQHTMDDAERYMKFYNIPEIAKFLPDGLIFRTLQEAQEEITHRRGNFFKQETIYWCIAKKSTNELIGGCGFLDWSKYNRRIEIAYDLMPEYHNKGIITSAIHKLTAFAFLKLNIVRLGATTPTDNENSIHVLTKKANFDFEGTLKSYKFWKGRYIDVNHFSIDLKSFCNLCRAGKYSFLTQEEKQKLYDFELRIYS